MNTPPPGCTCSLPRAFAEEPDYSTIDSAIEERIVPEESDPGIRFICPQCSYPNLRVRPGICPDGHYTGFVRFVDCDHGFNASHLHLAHFQEVADVSIRGKRIVFPLLIHQNARPDLWDEFACANVPVPDIPETTCWDEPNRHSKENS